MAKQKQFQSYRAVVAVLVAAGLLAGCGSAVKLDEKSGADVTTATGTSAGGTGSTSNVPTVTTNPNALGADALRDKSVFFDYDSFVVKQDYQRVVTAHASYLNADRSRKVMIEGNTDERGGREYNLALGQKRSEAVRRAMALLGVKEDQMEAVSFGKEKPRTQGNNEAAWADNRRADIQARR